MIEMNQLCLAARIRVALFVALVLLVSAASAQVGWLDQKGHSAADTDSRKSREGFGGWIIATSDTDWKAKWETPSSTVPEFSQAKSVERGKQVFVLIFFANPQLNPANEANVTCDINVVRPDGSVSTNQSNLVCFKGALQGNPQMMYLSAPVIAFVGDPGDPAGKWLVHVTLKDNNRKVEVPLGTSFLLVNK
jgi:hypothetical protein